MSPILRNTLWVRHLSRYYIWRFRLHEEDKLRLIDSKYVPDDRGIRIGAGLHFGKVGRVILVDGMSTSRLSAAERESCRRSSLVEIKGANALICASSTDS